MAPIWLRSRFLYLIGRETKYAREGRQARIIAKMNSLCDKELIAALYEASCAGVKISLIVRGICSLIPGIPEVSENIEVRSIVGNFLEHSRIFYFKNDGREEIYCASADWMPRNLDKRVEILFPVEKEELKRELLHILNLQLEDNMGSHIKQRDGSYIKADRRGKQQTDSQKMFCVEAKKLAKQDSKEERKRVFLPRDNRG